MYRQARSRWETTDMNKLLAILLAGAMLAPSAGLTHSHKRKSLEIVHPYTMETTKGTTTPGSS
jgi:hypothetical protein